MTPWGAEEELDSQALFGRTILQVAAALDASAAAFACVEVAASLAEAGARALVAGAPGPLVSELQARGGVFLPFAAPTRNPWKALLNRRRLERLAVREGVELIHVRGAAALPAAFFVARRLRIPVVAEFDGDNRTLALDADSILTFSRAAFDEAANARPEAASRLFLGPRGVDLRRFLPDAVDSSRVGRWRQTIGVKAHERLIVAIGLPPARQKIFLAAAAQLKAKGFFANDAQQARFVWLWRDEKDSARAAFDAEVEKLGLGDAVAQGGIQERAAACLGAALVVVGAGDAALCIEAQAMGAPVALLAPEGAAAGFAPEEIAAPPQVEAFLRTGWLIPSGQPQALARAAEEATRLGATARDRFSQRARAHARQFSAERMCGLTLSVYARHFSGAGR
ncbi:glycosyltransferase [uncultured Rhodoblastus sp.]|uniref:glycosyltransferase n=1 Tax=uncultured Rhodoblastus sp. TaxID=543037 RepID=UPI0025E90776|nr:glycosyltransferase [uncultured Rhodoblastus sp.]